MSTIKTVWVLTGPEGYWGCDSTGQFWATDPARAVHFADRRSAFQAVQILGRPWTPVEHWFPDA